MKKMLALFCLCGFILPTALSQITDAEKKIALDLVSKNSSAIGLSRDDLSNSIVTGTYIVPGSDVRMLYLQQSYKGIPVHNILNVLAFKSDKLVSNAGKRIAGMEQKLTGDQHIPAISSERAVGNAMKECNVTSVKPIVAQKISANGLRSEYGDLEVSSQNITSELLWYPVPGTDDLKLVWQVFIAPYNSSDYWLIRVDAKNGEVIDKESLTVYCNWHKEEHSTCEMIDEKPHINARNYVISKDNTADRKNSLPVVNTATYRVIKFPAESPQHPGGAHTTVTDPWTMIPGNATTLGWHNDGTTYYDSTRGNNVFAYEDRDNNNLPGLGGLSTTPQPALTFDFNPDYSLEPVVGTPAPNQQFNTTNLFYWNNLMHDISYLYGFTETARNFQNDNQDRGGIGADYVLAEAQDGSGVNNANFAAPPEGYQPRMQMYLWTAPTPDRDGDVDNGIIVHEYAHGISSRMTGSGFNCLSNGEQMGEGWSDYFSLMLTHDWSIALPGDGFSQPRGIATYAKNQPVTGPGIRQYRYCTDMSVNPLTYANLPTVAHPHGTGTIWCTVLWDMTWEIIQTAGINPDILDISANGGNVIAMKLVMEGMRLQPCSPGFIDGRNAILKADTLFFGAQYSCAIINAFARRGMGVGASQGSAGLRTDQTVNFDGCPAPSCTAPIGLTSSGVTNTSATVSWSAVSGAISYDVDYKPNSSSTWINAAMGTTSLSVALTGLATSTLYSWRTKANCSGSSSNYSQSYFTTACQSIYDNTTNGNTSGAATIALNTDIKGIISPVLDEDHYRFHITAGGTITVTLTTLPDNYDLDLLKANGTRIGRSRNTGTANETINATVGSGDYFAKVYPKGNATNASSCYTLRVQTGTASLVEENLIVYDRFSMYPNPATAQITLRNTDHKILGTVSIFDISGKVIYRKFIGNSQTTIDVKNFSAGVYYIRSDQLQTAIKLVKQ